MFLGNKSHALILIIRVLDNSDERKVSFKQDLQTFKTFQQTLHLHYIIAGQLNFLDLDVVKKHTTCSTNWPKTATNDTVEDLMPAANTDCEVTHTGRPAPDMRNGSHGEVAAPRESYTHTTKQGDEFVAASLAALKTCVGSFPDTVNRPHSLWFAYDVFPGYLRKLKKYCTVCTKRNANIT